MKLQTSGSKTTFSKNSNTFLIFFLLLNIFTMSNSYALGSKRPVVNKPPTPTAPPSTGDGTSTTVAASLLSPWTKEKSTIVIDAYDGNSIDWDKMASDRKVAGVIHRSSIGLKVDSQYVARKKIALERGYLWGAYHLGRPGNTIAQADLFLSLIKDEPNTLMILDLEDTGSGSFMTINEAVVFMNYVYEKTGRIPTVYANHSTTVLLNQKVKSNPLFQQSKLWYARFKANVTDFPAVYGRTIFYGNFRVRSTAQQLGHVCIMFQVQKQIWM